MIKISFSNEIRIETGNLKYSFAPDQLPLKFEIQRAVSKEIIWTTELDSNMWATYPESEINHVLVYDAKGKFVYQRFWEPVTDGSIFYQALALYCKSVYNKLNKVKGLVIGTHDGEFGEWVPVVLKGLSDMVLVEGSRKQYDKLYQNYKNKPGIKTIHNLVTTDGSEVEFWEGGKGYTNTVVKRVIDYWEREPIAATKRSSISINDLIEQECNGKIDWLHLDVEGLDAKLLMAVNPKYLPGFIIFEDFNLPQEEKDTIYAYLKDFGYRLHSEAGICMAALN
jgi:hypothetical protein